MRLATDRLAILECVSIHAPTPQADRLNDQQRASAAFYDFSGSVDLDPARHPRLDGRQVVDHEGDQLIPSFHIFILESPGDVESGDDEFLAVKAESNRSDIRLI